MRIILLLVVGLFLSFGFGQQCPVGTNFTGYQANTDVYGNITGYTVLCQETEERAWCRINRPYLEIEWCYYQSHLLVNNVPEPFFQWHFSEDDVNRIPDRMGPRLPHRPGFAESCAAAGAGYIGGDTGWSSERKRNS